MSPIAPAPLDPSVTTATTTAAAPRAKQTVLEHRARRYGRPEGWGVPDDVESKPSLA